MAGDKERNMKEIYEQMAEWNAFVRRHNATIFDVMFKDIDYDISEDTMHDIIVETAEFFHIPYPAVVEKCERLAEVKINEQSSHNDYSLSYNLDLLKKAGANNKDTLTLCLTHELCHEFNKNTTFMLCRSERWTHELACDYICGIRSCRMNLATGKYKYIVGKMSASITHPPGRIRAEIVAYAREFYHRLFFDERRDVTFEAAMEGFPAFIYRHSKELNAELQIAAEKEKELQLHPHAQEEEHRMTDINSLADNNLIKQYVLKLKEQNNKVK
jgi:hypothetical protein